MPLSVTQAASIRSYADTKFNDPVGDPGCLDRKLRGKFNAPVGHPGGLDRKLRGLPRAMPLSLIEAASIASYTD